MTEIQRRDFLARLAAAGAATAFAGAALAEAAPGWKTMDPIAAGFKTNLEVSFKVLQDAGRLAGLHGIVATRRGQIVFERYMAGKDDAWGKPLGEVKFGPDTLHDLRSVTKSIVGLLYGIALAAKKVPAPDQPLVAQFPEYPELAAKPGLARLTVAHALTMTLGTDWNERVPYTDPKNSEILMEQAPDRYRFILDRPVLAAPGRGWIYNGGAVALLGRLIEKGTGQPLPDYARAALFKPLGITSMEWAKGDDGVASAASGLRLTPRDLARIGNLVLASGNWNGQQLVPKAWLEASFTRAAMAEDSLYYGYLWYLGDIPLAGKGGVVAQRLVAALGNGGQRLWLLPEFDFALAVTAGNYDTPNQWVAPAVLLRQVFMAGLAD